MKRLLKYLLDGFAWLSVIVFVIWAAGAVLFWPNFSQWIRPSNDRQWTANQSWVARVKVQQGVVTIENFRNFHYRSETDFDVNFETRSFALDDLDAVWLVVQKFSSFEGLAHVLLSFGIDTQSDDRAPTYFSLSIEVRSEQHETYSPIKGIYRNYELAHVIV